MDATPNFFAARSIASRLIMGTLAAPAPTSSRAPRSSRPTHHRAPGTTPPAQTRRSPATGGGSSRLLVLDRREQPRLHTQPCRHVHLPSALDPHQGRVARADDRREFSQRHVINRAVEPQDDSKVRCVSHVAYCISYGA